MSTNEEERKLYETLDAEEIHPAILAQGFPEFSAAAKNAIVAQLASTYQPAPSGRVLARLPTILTDENRDNMVTAFLANYHAPDPEARRASLYGLMQLGYSGITDLALLSLRDPADPVVAAACDILVPRARTDPRIMGLLRGLYENRKDDLTFHMSLGILRAHGIDQLSGE